MSYTAELLVQDYLTANGRAFVCPQYEIAYDPVSGTGGSSADFVVLNFKDCEVIVVEVTTASNLSKLVERVKERRTRWFLPLQSSLLANKAITDKWTFRFLGFVREAALPKLAAAFSAEELAVDVCFSGIERVGFPHQHWEKRDGGLPRNI